MTGTTRDAKRARTAQRILEAAQEEFAAQGFEGTTIRAVAARAGVHASLVMQHYGSKAALFAIAVRLPPEDDQAAADHLLDVLDVRMGDLPPETRALVRSMLTVPEAEAAVREFLQERIENLQGTLEGADAELRALLAVCSILGLTIARHFLKLPAFETVPRRELVDAAHAWITAPVKPASPAGPAGPVQGPVT